jgi:hypothetical protein
LHALNGTRLGTLFAVSLLFSSALADHVAGGCTPEVGGLELLNTPEEMTSSGSDVVDLDGNTNSNVPAFFLVELVTHTF